MGGGDTCVVQVTNVAPTTSLEQMSTLFGYVGTIRDIKLYPNDDLSVKVCYVKYSDPRCVGVAQHLTNTVFIDRALIVIPVSDGKIPDEATALSLTNSSGGSSNSGLVSQVVSGPGGTQVITTIDPRLTALGLPQYPPLPANMDPAKIEEIRRTVYVGNVDSSLSGEQVLKFFNQMGEIKYLRMAGDDSQPTRFAFVEFTEQSSVANALQYNGAILSGKPLKINHSNNAIVKPQTNSESNQKEIEEAMKRVREAQSLISAAIDPNSLKIVNSPDRKSRSRSRSRVRSRRSRSRSRRRSISRERRRSRSRSRRRTRSRSRSRRRSRSRSRRRSRSRGRRSRSIRRYRSRSPRRRRRSRSRSIRRRSRSRDRRSRSLSHERRRRRSYSRDRDSRRRRSVSRERDKERSRRRRISRSRSRDRNERDKDRDKERDHLNKTREKSPSEEPEGPALPPQTTPENNDEAKISQLPEDGKEGKIDRETSEWVAKGPATPPETPSPDIESDSRMSPQHSPRSPVELPKRSPRRRRTRSRSRSVDRHRRRSRSPHRRRRSRSRSRDRRRSRSRSREKHRRRRERERERDRRSKSRSRDRHRERRRRRRERERSLSKESKIQRNYDEEEKGYDSDEKGSKSSPVKSSKRHSSPKHSSD